MGCQSALADPHQLGQMLYQPVRWQGVAQALHEAINGNGTLARDYIPNGWHEALVADPEKARRLDTDNVFGTPVAQTASAIFSILCSDQPGYTEDKLGDLVHLSGDVSARCLWQPH